MSAVELPEIDKIRLYVVDDEGRARSDVWFIHSTGDHVYAAPRKLGGALKLSLHPAGAAQDGYDCQFGHPRSHAHKQESRGYRPIPPMRWRRPSTPETGAVHVASILFPTDALVGTVDIPNDGKVKFGIPLAPVGQVAEAALFFSREAPASLESKFIQLGGTPLIYMDLLRGEFVSVVVRHASFPDLPQEFAKLGSGRPIPLSGTPKPGETVSGRALAICDIPAAGSPFYLVEAGPVSVTNRGTPDT